jgi:hypothetical protein
VLRPLASLLLLLGVSVPATAQAPAPLSAFGPGVS